MADPRRAVGMLDQVEPELYRYPAVDPGSFREAVERAFRVDLTPPDLIDRYVTEEGMVAPDEIAALVDRTPFLREGYELLRS